MTEQEKYLDGHRNCGIKVGDRVRVTRKARCEEAGWKNMWMSNMDSAVGLIGNVYMDAGRLGFSINFDIEEPNLYDYPYFVLEKI